MAEKTEQPTDKKLRDARKKGQVPKSKDFTQTVLFLALFGYLLLAGGRMIERLTAMILAPMSLTTLEFGMAASGLTAQLLEDAAFVLLPFVGIVLFFGILAESVQTGMVLAFEALKPSARKLDMFANAKNMFSKKNLTEFLKSIVKIVFLSGVVTLLLQENLDVLVDLPLAGFTGVGIAVGDLLTLLLANVGLAYLVIALFDLVWQRMHHRKELMMSKDEVKQEYKQMEGDPHIKHERKSLHRELLEGGAVQKAKSASVVVTNPTHLAVALRYRKEETPLPVVLAKGEGALAERMMAAAREAGVPVMQNIPLARALFETAHEDQYIPSDLIEPVAEVLRLVRELAERGGRDSANVEG